MDSLEAQIIAGFIKNCLSLRSTLNTVNLHLEDQGEESLTISSIRDTVAALKTKLLKVSRIIQGSKDVTSPWAHAWKNWVTQLLVIFGNIKSIYSYDIFNRSKIQSLTTEQVSWWDKTHIKCVIGGICRFLEYCINFPYDEMGKIDPENGSYSSDTYLKMNVKFDQYIRLCL